MDTCLRTKYQKAWMELEESWENVVPITLPF
jgi:hypothetical protein